MSVFSRLSMVEAASVFVGVLAYPRDPTKAEMLAGFLICAAVDNMLADARQAEEVPPESLRLACRLRDRTEGERLVADACRIVSSERLIAAKMAWPTLHAAATGITGVDVPGPTSQAMISAVSIDLAAPTRPKDRRGRKAFGGEAEGNKSNVQDRCWKRSLPVLHMAVALQGVTAEAEISGFNVGCLIGDPDLTERLVRRSASIAPLIAQTFNVSDQIIIAPFGVQ